MAMQHVQQAPIIQTSTQI